MLHTSSETLELIDRALREDQASADVTTEALIPPDLVADAAIVAKATGVLAGVAVAGAVFCRVDPSVENHAVIADGSSIKPGDVVSRVRGPMASILRAERTALNFIQRMSGIATATAQYVEAVRGLNVRIVDTRKTAPGLRHLDKYAVRMGGGHNHRRDLASGILVKDNHIAALAGRGLSLAQVVRKVKEAAPHTLKVEIEVETLGQAKEALEAGAELLLLDNMGLDEMRKVVALARGRAVTEASGGVTLETVRQVAEVGVDLISVGALTHSVKALDISLEMELP